MFGVTSRETGYNKDELLIFQLKAKSDYLNDGFTAQNHIFSKFYDLANIKHPNLAEYVSISKAVNGEIILVTESAGPTLRKYLSYSHDHKKFIKMWFFQILSALEHLHHNGIPCGNISLDTINIAIELDNSIRLTNFGLQFITLNGELVEYPTVPVQYAAPEQVANSPTCKSDIYSVGISFGEVITGLCKQKLELITSLEYSKMIQTELDRCPTELNSLIKQCLQSNPNDRPTVFDILKSNLITDLNISSIMWSKLPILPGLPIANSSLLSGKDIIGLKAVQLAIQKLAMSNKSKRVPSILALPKSISAEKQLEMPEFQRAVYFDQPIKLDLKNILGEVHQLDSAAIRLLERKYFDNSNTIIPWDSTNVVEIWNTINHKSALHSSKKARNLEYSYFLILKFKKLLGKFPISRPLLIQEATQDIPSTLRGLVWSAILNIKGDPRFEYEALITSSILEDDHQIDIDIRRCHQYHPMLATPNAHSKIKRILKAWIKAEYGRFVYWQGLDSLCACFLTVNFNDEALAFSSMKEFINIHLDGFFAPDNSEVINKRIQQYQSLICFHEPEIARHFEKIGFSPKFYGISWFMTIFARNCT